MAVNADDTFKTSGSKGMWELGGEEGQQGKEMGSAQMGKVVKKELKQGKD